MGWRCFLPPTLNQGVPALTFIIGLILTIGSILGGYVALGGHLYVLWQPYEFIIILGSAIGSFFVANPMKVVKDTCAGIMEAIKESTPKPQEYLDLLALLYGLMKELRSKSRTEMETHVDNPDGVVHLHGLSVHFEGSCPDAFHLRLCPPDCHRQCAHP